MRAPWPQFLSGSSGYCTVLWILELGRDKLVEISNSKCKETTVGQHSYIEIINHTFINRNEKVLGFFFPLEVLLFDLFFLGTNKSPQGIFF